MKKDINIFIKDQDNGYSMTASIGTDIVIDEIIETQVELYDRLERFINILKERG